MKHAYLSPTKQVIQVFLPAEIGSPEWISGIKDWGESFELQDRIVGKDKVGDVEVSTVFLGIAHGFGRAPMWFETMIFGGVHDGYQIRYETYAQALEGHNKLLGALGLGENPEALWP